jgi:hypothetical protein
MMQLHGQASNPTNKLHGTLASVAIGCCGSWVSYLASLKAKKENGWF